MGAGGLGVLFDTRMKYSCRMVGEGEVGALFAHSTIHAAEEEEVPAGDRRGYSAVHATPGVVYGKLTAVSDPRKDGEPEGWSSASWR